MTLALILAQISNEFELLGFDGNFRYNCMYFRYSCEVDLDMSENYPDSIVINNILTWTELL